MVDWCAVDYTPQLATLVKTPPPGDAWLHEIKYDGYRIGARITKGGITLTSRNGKDWTASFPEVVKAIAALGLKDSLIDGEVAMVRPDGRTSFQDLQHALSGSGPRARLVYFAFDLLRHDGHSLTGMPLEDRKARLHAIIAGDKSGRLRYSDHIIGDGQALLDHARTLGLEGIISKKRGAPHRPGRGTDWTKTKLLRRQEFVVGGYTDQAGSRGVLAALLLGCYDDDGHLQFTGSVGTGFSQKVATDLRQRLDRLARATCPFHTKPDAVQARQARWVTPSLVCEVAFGEWTADGRIRHPSFQGLRTDKAPKDVRLERS
jgi:bifunctional non-homologous end joining protein LigD